MKHHIFKIALCICLLLCLTPVHSRAQEAGHQKLFSLIEARLEQPGGDTAHYFMLEQVRRHCGKNNDCLVSTFKPLMQKLERRFNLPAAIYVGGEIAKIARQQGDLGGEARAHQNLSRFHSAIGNYRLAIVHLEQALRLFKQAGDHSAALYAKATILELGLGYRDINDVITNMEALLAEAVERNDKGNVTYLQLRLINITKSAKQYDKMETYVSAIEKSPLSNPIKANEYSQAIHAKLGRADLLMVQGKVEEAERFYQKALRLCEEEPSRWLEIQVLHTLAQLEWERKNARLAKTYLDSAYFKAERLELHEHLASNFELKALIAEAEKRYADALNFTKKRQFHQTEFDKRGEGFSAQSYYLQLEKDQLAAEKETQSLQLSLKNSQLRNSLLLTGLLLLLAAGLFIGFYKQRQAKNKLAAQNALIQQQAVQLQSLDAAKSRFFANISHELRTPLTLLLGTISALKKEGGMSEKQEKLFQIASNGGNQLQHLVNQILDLGKLDVGKMEVNREPVRAAAFFANYFAQFESLAERNGVTYTFENRVDKSLTLALDKEKCRQIVFNLLSNAFKFTQAGGSVRGILSLENWRLQLGVSDTGTGIHPDDLPHVFERYFQTNQHDAPATGGTGIGLAVCQDYAQLFGGKIEVESTLGKGASFRVSFPAEMLDAESQPEEREGFNGQSASDFVPENENAALLLAPAQTDIAPDKPTLLVVEDNPDLQDYFRLILKQKYQVLMAGNGQEALDILRDGFRDEGRGMRDESGTGIIPHPSSLIPNIIPHPSSLIPDAIPHPSSLIPDLILSDLMMPVMDGYQLLEKLKGGDATRHIPVIMLTARAEATDRLKALRIGVDDYLTKPFEEEELLLRIENLLRNRAARQEADPTTEAKTEHLPAALPSDDLAWLEKFEAFVRKNLSKNILAVPMLAYEFAMSESTLLRQLKRLTGLTPQQYLTEMRLHEARHLLENRQFNSLSKVASEVGYADVRSFSRSFKGRFGKLPSDFLND